MVPLISFLHEKRRSAGVNASIPDARIRGDLKSELHSIPNWEEWQGNRRCIIEEVSVMGRARRPQPAKLAGKLLEIRKRLSLSQGQMMRLLEHSGTKLYAPHLSGYESGTREPPLAILIEYAEAANICVDVLINDALELPEKLPAKRRRHMA